MAILIKMHLASDSPQCAEYAFADHSQATLSLRQGRVRLQKDSGEISVTDDGGYSNIVHARVIHKLRQHWAAKELPRETSFAA